ncbi:MAG: Fe-S cluster assembly protein SufD [Acidobacteria bacterium]|nr:Fe-S cluster assembly protein SufD [Acidobacteriota bacterium]
MVSLKAHPPIDLRLPSWLADLQRSAAPLFADLDMPSERQEEWRYVDLSFDLEEYSVASGGVPTGVDVPYRSDVGALAITDGALGSLANDLPNGVVFGSALDVAESLVVGHFGRGIPTDRDVFAAAHQAFAGDGAFLHIASGTALAEPLTVEVSSTQQGTVSFPRFTVVVEDNAEASAILYLSSADDVDCLVLPQIEVSVGANSHFKLTVVQRLGANTRSIADVFYSLAKDATGTFTEIGLGGAYSRVRLDADIVGNGSHMEIVGAYFGDGDQVLDYRYFLDHIGVGTTSSMFLKGAVEDDSASVFTGMIRIEKGAQKTNAHQTNRNLILSAGASAQSVPNLEILANDVKCGHASTMGPLDEEQRYYLMSRGLDRARADRLQVKGFFEEALTRVSHRQIRDALRIWINEKFVAAQSEGRL